MGRRIARLTLDNLGDLPAHCARCLVWEVDPVRRGHVDGHERDEKAAWLSEVLREWGSCGRILYVDDVYAGHLLWAPPVFLPGGDAFATAPVSGDAVLLATGHVVEELRGGGLGRMLVQSMAKDLLRHSRVRAVEAFGDSRRSPHGCVLPTDFLLGVGFATHRPHAVHPRMRMELRSAITWRSELESALERLLPLPRRLGAAPRAPGHARPATPVTSRPIRGHVRGAVRHAAH